MPLIKNIFYDTNFPYSSTPSINDSHRAKMSQMFFHLTQVDVNLKSHTLNLHRHTKDKMLLSSITSKILNLVAKHTNAILPPHTIFMCILGPITNTYHAHY